MPARLQKLAVAGPNTESACAALVKAREPRWLETSNAPIFFSQMPLRVSKNHGRLISQRFIRLVRSLFR